MNIGIVTTWEERGASYVSKQYIDALNARFNVKVFARGGTNSSHGSSIFREKDCYRSQASNRIYSTYIRKREFLSWVKRNSIEIVFFNEQNWWPPVVWCKEESIHTGAYVDYYTEKTIPFFDLYDFLICNTRRHHSAFNWHPYAYYVPWGTDVDLFRPVSKDIGDKTVFFHSCGMSPQRKGTDLLLKAYAEIASSRTKLIIHSQKDLSDYIRSSLRCSPNEIKDKDIEVIEKTVSAPGLYHLGHIYVYPTRLEGIGLTILEALSCGLPVIVPDDAPMNEFVSNERGKLVELDRKHARCDGYYWPMNIVNIENLVQKMKYYIENPTAIEEESRNAREYAKAELSWRKRYTLVNEIFEESLKRPMRNNDSKCRDIIQSEKSVASRAKRLVMEVDSFVKNASANA